MPYFIAELLIFTFTSLWQISTDSKSQRNIFFTSLFVCWRCLKLEFMSNKLTMATNGQYLQIYKICNQNSYRMRYVFSPINFAFATKLMSNMFWRAMNAIKKRNVLPIKVRGSNPRLDIKMKIWKRIFLRRVPVSRLLARTVRVNKIAKICNATLNGTSRHSCIKLMHTISGVKS